MLRLDSCFLRTNRDQKYLTYKTEEAKMKAKLPH